MSFKDYIVKEKAVICRLEAGDWKEAVIEGGRVLVDRGSASPEYMTTIVQKCLDNGPYIVIAPGIAMPHARPEEGALALGYGIVTLKNPVNFGDPDNDPVNLLIFMAAPDVKQHNEVAVSEIAELCDEEELIKEIVKARSAGELLTIIEEKEL